MKKLTLLKFFVLLFSATIVQAQDLRTTCNEENPSNAFEKGYLSGTGPLLPMQVAATDITIAAGTDMSLTTINANLWVRGIGETVESANIVIYGDASGLPNGLNIVNILTDMVPTSQPSIGTAGVDLDFDVLDVTFDIPATMLAGQAGEATAYWVVIYITASNGGDAAWEATSTTSVGNDGALSPNGGATWQTVPSNYDFVYNFSGDCTPITAEEHVINPVSASTTLTAEYGSSLDNTINGAGLDAFPSLSATHEATSPGNSFLATYETGSIDFDLGGSYLVDGFTFWNENGPGPGGSGIQEVVVSSSLDGVTFTPIAGSPTTFTRVISPTSPPEMFSFDVVTASYIRFDVVSNYGDPGNLVAFAEVAFSGVEAPIVENVINPVSASTTLTAKFGSSLDNAINGAGLDDFPSLSATHQGTNPGNSFLANFEPGSIDFDLGGSYLVDGFTFWNENGPGPGGSGIQEVVVSSSVDGVTYTPIAGSPTTFTRVISPTSPPEMFSFDVVTASYIRFDVVSNYGDPGNLVAFAEVAFSGVEAPIVENVINPVSASTTLTAKFGSSLDNTINGAGLDDFPSLSATHQGTNPGNSFLANFEPGSIDFDLGGSYLVDGFTFWNENGPGPGGSGIQEVVVSSSLDGVTFTPIAGSPTTFTRVMSPTSPPEMFSFDVVTASFIRFDVVSNYGDPGNLVAFAEVAFSGVEAPIVENVINPVSASTTLTAKFGSSLDNTINGAGLDDFPSLSATHQGTNPGNSFLANFEPGSIDFDLGGSYLVDGFTFWNENGPGPGGSGIQEVVVSSSLDGVTFTPIAGSPTTFTRVMSPTSPPEMFSFDVVTASFIRFDVVSNYGDPGNLVAFAEVAFSGVALAQQISLQPGWTIISSYLQPTSPALETVFSEISNSVAFMFANSGIYWPSANINTIGDWDVYTGYKIKMNANAVVNFAGQKSGNSVNLSVGTNFLPVLSESAVDNGVLFDLGSALNYAFDLQTESVFWPEGGLYTLTSLEPGKGYLLSLNTAATMVFPENNLKSGITQQESLFVNTTPWNDVNKTGEIHIISIDKNSLGNLQAGDVLGAFNSNGLNVGMAEYTDASSNLSLVVYGDDMTTGTIDGLSENETIALKLFRASDNSSANLTATYDLTFNGGSFIPNGTSKIIDLKGEALGINPINESSFNLYPNPAHDILNISNCSDQNINKVEIINSQGQKVYASGMKNNASMAIDISGLSKGLYFVNLLTDSDVIVKKILVN